MTDGLSSGGGAGEQEAEQLGTGWEGGYGGPGEQ